MLSRWVLENPVCMISIGLKNRVSSGSPLVLKNRVIFMSLRLQLNADMVRI